jgi:hypothetical protein
MRLSYAIHQQSKLDSRSTSRVNIATNEAGRLLSYHYRDDGGLDLDGLAYQSFVSTSLRATLNTSPAAIHTGEHIEVWGSFKTVEKV